MIVKNGCFLFLSVFLLLASNSAIGQIANKALNGDIINDPTTVDVLRKNVSICFIYDERGAVSRITIEPHPVLETYTGPLMIEKEKVMELAETFFPVSERGDILSKPQRSFGRAYAETVNYRRGTLNLTLTCGNGICGVTFVEIRFKRD